MAGSFRRTIRMKNYPIKKVSAFHWVTFLIEKRNHSQIITPCDFLSPVPPASFFVSLYLAPGRIFSADFPPIKSLNNYILPQSKLLSTSSIDLNPTVGNSLNDAEGRIRRNWESSKLEGTENIDEKRTHRNFRHC